jgi:MFS family permease
MSTFIAPEPAVATLASGTAARPVIRSAADVSQLVNRGAAVGSDARIVIAIALGGVFLDAYDLGALAFGVKDIAREFSLTPTATGFVASAITFGAIIGACLGGYLPIKSAVTACSWPTCSSSWSRQSHAGLRPMPGCSVALAL